MRIIRDGKDRTVSEVIGTIFVFAIFIALLTTLVAWYIPSTETSADQNYEANMINAMSSITSTLSNPNIPSGTQINQILPTGIAGTVVSPSTPTSVAFSDSGFTENASYGVGLGFYYLNQHPTAGVLNKVVGTFPYENISNPTAEFYCVSNHYLYVIGHGSNNMAIINTVTGTVVSFVYAGGNPDAMAFDPLNHYLYIADEEAIQLSRGKYYSTISVISTLNNTYIRSFDLPSSVTSPISLTYGNGELYASARSKISEINPQTGQPINTATNSVNIKDIYYYNSKDVLIVINNGEESYNVYSSSLNPVKTCTFTSVTGITLESVTSGSTLFFFTYNDSSSGGILASLPCSGSIVSHSNFAKGVYAYNLTYIGGNLTAVITHNSTSGNDMVLEEYNDATAKTFNQVGEYQSSAGLNFICYNGDVKVSSGETLGMIIASNFQLDEEIMIQVSSGNSNDLSLYSTIYDNYFINPYDSVYDIINNLLYFSNYCSGTVSVISPINQSLLSIIALGVNSHPTYMAVNSTSGLVYVLESGNSSIALINGISLLKDHPYISLPAGYVPNVISYDAFTQTAFLSANTPKSPTNIATVFELTGFNISNYYNLSGYKAGFISFDAYNNQTYAILCKGTSYYLYDVNTKTEVVNLESSGTAGRYTMSFDYLDGYLFLVFSSGKNYGQVQVYSPAFTLYSVVTTGYDPSGSVFDGGNNLLYVTNYCSTEGDNVTVINAENFTILTTIWIGGGPENPAFDSENGYIYIPDNLSDKSTVIDGGFTIYKGKPGVLESNVINSAGMIEASGNTQFISPVQFYNEGGFLVENYTDQNYDNIVGSLPISVTNQSGELFFTFVDSGFTMPGIVSSKTVSSTTPTEAKLQISNKVDSSYYVGDQFYLSDVFGNQYIAIVTGVFLEYFTVTMHTPFSSLVNKYLYSQYNGTSSVPPDSWFFSSVPIHVRLSGSEISLSLQKPVELYSVSILFYDVNVEAL